MKALMLGLVAFLSLQQAHAAWKIQKAGFQADDMIKIKTGDRQEINSSGLYSNSYAFANRVELHGSITIKEYNEDTFSQKTTVIKNVYARMEAYGLMLRLGTIMDSYFPLKNLGGKPISAIFDSTFHGGKLGAGVGIILSVNPNYSLLINEHGIRIPNLEQWIGPGINLEVEVGYVSMDFNTKSQGAKGKNTVIITSGDPNGNQTTVKKAELKEVLNKVIGK